MQHPKDVKGSDRPKSLLSIPVGQRYTTILDRLDTIESDVKATHGRMITKVIHEDNNSKRLNTIETDFYVLEADTNDRLDAIESEIEVMKCKVTNNRLTLDEIEERIAMMQEKINGID